MQLMTPAWRFFCQAPLPHVPPNTCATSHMSMDLMVQVWRFLVDREIEAPDRFQAIQTHRAAMAVLRAQQVGWIEFISLGVKLCTSVTVSIAGVRRKWSTCSFAASFSRQWRTW